MTQGGPFDLAPLCAALGRRRAQRRAGPKPDRCPLPARLRQTRRAKGVVLGVACGVGAAACWAGGFVAARHGIAAGLSPFDIAFHRYVWAGLFFLPGVLRRGIGGLDGIGWGRGLLLAMLGGPFQAIVSASGFLLVPLAHGGVIQPSVMVLTGLLLATLVLGEKQPPNRICGAAMIIVGIAVIGGEALTSIGRSGMLGDAAFALAGALFAAFGTLLRLWRIIPARATAVIATLTLLYVPLHAAVFGFGRMAAAGWFENALQIVAQGVFSGPGAIYLFARSVALLGASRATVFPSLVPGLTLLIGFLVLGETPSVLQLSGLAVVLIGFRLTQA
jgi:drug/metabolite transporter (DMT)-like permease